MMMADLEKCTKGLKDVLHGEWLLLDGWMMIEANTRTRAKTKDHRHTSATPTATHTHEYTHAQ